MNPATIILRAEQDGVNLALSTAGTIKATGNHEAITRWLEIIREHKNGIISTLRGADLPEPENEHQLEAGDYLELDALILRYADLTNMPAEHLGKLQAARRRMSPALIQADIEQFMEWIANLEFLSGEIKL